MTYNSEQLDGINIHFVLCTERTGSSLLSLMLNLNNRILCPSEEPFALYFYKKYRHKISWTESDIDSYVDEFFMMAEKNTDLYFSDRKEFTNSLKMHLSVLNWSRLVKLTYLHFIDGKDKATVDVIIDKQIKYFFHIPMILTIFPNARFIILVRDVRDNIVSKRNRKLNWNQHPMFLAALWKETYRRITLLPKNQIKCIRYEDFMQETEDTLRQICHWVDVPFQEQMMETEGKYLNFIEQQKSKLDPTFVEHLLKFHSGLSQRTSTKQIGQFKQELTEQEIRDIERICKKELTYFGYELNTVLTGNTFSFKACYYLILAKCYRNWLLKLYYMLPFFVKLKIKKSRKDIAPV